MKRLMKATMALSGCAILISSTNKLAAAKGASRRSDPACLSTNDAADGFRLYITGIDTTTADSGSTLRAFWHVSQVAASEIYFVSDSASCARGARAHAESLAADTLDPSAVHLLRIGPTRYVVFNFTRLGEWFHYVVLDSNFALVGTRGS